MGAIADAHWNCSIQHPTRRGHRRDRLHEAGCQVAEGHTPGTIALHCAECARAYRGQRADAPHHDPTAIHYACTIPAREHFPRIKGAVGGHRAGCATQPGHEGGAKMCPACYKVRLKNPTFRLGSVPAAERFAKLVKPQGNCEVWAGATDRNGYGLFWVSAAGPERKLTFAHRFAWEAAHGPIPRGLGVLHHCDTPLCVKTTGDATWPEGHLFLGTNADNNADAAEKGRNAWGERSARAKLTESDVREIRRLLPTTSLREIAQQFGVTEAAVHLIKTGKTWSRLT